MYTVHAGKGNYQGKREFGRYVTERSSPNYISNALTSPCSSNQRQAKIILRFGLTRLSKYSWLFVFGTNRRPY